MFTHTTAIFRQVNKDIARTHHDALEFPDGKMVLLNDFLEGQEATVLQLPAQPVTAVEITSRQTDSAHRLIWTPAFACRIAADGALVRGLGVGLDRLSD